MRPLFTARMAAGNVTNSNPQADTRCVEVVSRCGHLSGLALSQTDNVFLGRSGLFHKEHRFSKTGADMETAISTTVRGYVSSLQVVNTMIVYRP
jgi:hypothetical protein